MPDRHEFHRGWRMPFFRGRSPKDFGNSFRQPLDSPSKPEKPEIVPFFVTSPNQVVWALIDVEAVDHQVSETPKQILDRLRRPMEWEYDKEKVRAAVSSFREMIDTLFLANEENTIHYYGGLFGTNIEDQTRFLLKQQNTDDMIVTIRRINYDNGERDYTVNIFYQKTPVPDICLYRSFSSYNQVRRIDMDGEFEGMDVDTFFAAREEGRNDGVVFEEEISDLGELFNKAAPMEFIFAG